MNLDALKEHLDPEGELPPVDRWHPDHQGDMDLEITADGRWFHEGSPVARPRLVRLLSTLLRREDDGHYVLVTPVEKWRIRVADRPFLIVDADQTATGDWWLITNLGDRVRLDGDHRLVLSETPTGESIPEVPVRFGLAARLGRNVYYRLVEQAESREVDDGSTEFGLTSGGVWHSLGRLAPEAPCA